MGGRKRGTGEASGEGTGRGRKKGAAGDEPSRRKPAGRGDAARPGGMALVDPWGALLAGLLVVGEEEPAAGDLAGGGERGGGREPPDPIAVTRVRQPGRPRAARTRGRDKGATGAAGGRRSGS